MKKNKSEEIRYEATVIAPIGVPIVNGQTMKANEVIKVLQKKYTASKVKVVDTYRCKEHLIKFVFKLKKIVKNSERVILMVDANGIKLLIPYLTHFKKKYGFKVHYVVIGAWLGDLLAEKKKLLEKAKELDGIYVETQTLLNQVNALGLNNALVMKNFKSSEPVKLEDIKYFEKRPLRLIYYSRIEEKKGIEDIINAVIAINSCNDVIYTLDIYGSIHDYYEDRFKEIMAETPDYITYKGISKLQNPGILLNKYYMQVLPTKYKTEGIPGSILDSYFAGLPVLCSRWNSAADVVDDGVTGLIYDFDDFADLKDKLRYMIENVDECNKMRANCIKKAEEYRTETALQVLMERL